MFVFCCFFQWARYMRCDGSPDPTIPGEINTYINLRLEDNQNDDIETVLKHGELDIAVSYRFYLQSLNLKCLSYYKTENIRSRPLTLL